MAERRAAAKGRRMGSSRRKQLREGSGKAPAAAPSSGEEPPWASEIMERVQDFFRERDKDQAGFITRSDVQRLQEENFPCSMEELELVFDGLDAAGTGRLSTEEFIAGLWQFLSSQKAARDHRQLKTTSRRVRLVLPSPVLEGVDSEERRHFAAFMDQLGTDDISEEQEIWQLWVKLRQDEPQLLGNLEDFLAKMRCRIQEAKSKKEALEMTLNKRVAEHNKEVQQLCEALEQQIQQEQQRLQQESMARSHQHDMELQRALDASEREVQRLVMAQMELEARCRSLRSTQQATSTENQQLEESNRVLEDRLQHLHQQLQQTHGRLRTARAMVAWEHVEESGYRVVAELPSKTPMSPQTSPEKSEKYRSEMRIRLGSQSTEPKAKSIHQVVWEMPPPEISLLGPQQGPSSTEEDPFPEFLKEERFSDQSSLLREMNDAIAALSKQLKPQALGAPPVLAETARHPRDDAEPQMGPEAAAAHGTTPGVMRETLSSHVGHELFEGDLKEGPAAAELHAPDATQAGASVGARHRRAEEPGAEQGESLEEARRMLFLQGKGTGVKELMLKAAEHPQGALGESMEAGEQALVEMEGEGWMQEKIGWEKAQLLGEAKEAALNQGENPEAGFEPPEAGEAGLAAGWQLAADELGLAAAPEECAQHPGTGLGEEADLPLRLSEKLEIKPGEHLEPELPSWGEVRVGAAQGDGVLPKVTVASDPGMLEEEHVSAEVQPWGETLDANVLPAPAQRGGSGGAGAEEGEVEVTQPREAELQPRGESLRGDAVWGGSTAGEVPLPLAVPLADVQEGRVGPDVQPLEAQSSDANVQLLAEVEAARQPPSEAGSLGTEQGGSMAPGVQALEEDDKPELGLGEETGAAAVHGEGTSPAETPVGSPDLGGLFPVKAQALQLVEAEDLQADAQTRWVPGPETPQGGGDRAAMQLGEEAEDGAPGLGERELPHEPVTDLHGAGVGQGEGAGAGVQLWEEAVTLGTLEDQSADANVQLLAEAEELQFTPGGSTEAALEPPREAGYLDTEQGGCVAPDVQPLDEADKPELVELVEAEDLQADTQLHGGASPETPQGGGDHAAVCLGEEAEDGGPTQEPAFHPQGVATRQGEGAGEGVQPWEEAVTLGTLEDQSADANVQLIAEAEKLKLTPGGSTEAARQLPSEAGSLDTEQGGNVAPDVQPLDEADKPELVELVEAEDLQADTQPCGVPGPEPPQGGGDRAAMQLGEEAEDGAQGLGERELPHEPVTDLPGAGVGQGEGAGAEKQPGAEADEFSAGRGDPAALPVMTFGAQRPGAEVNGDVQHAEEEGELELVQGEGINEGGLFLVKSRALDMMEAEDSWADTQLRGGASPEPPQGGGDRAAVCLGEEAEDGAQGLGERELPHDPVLHPHGVIIRQGEGAPEGVQPREKAESLGTLEDQSTDASMQLLVETEKLKLTPGGSTEAAWQPPSEAGSPGTEQGGSMAPGVQALEEDDKPELGLGEETGAAAVHGEGTSPAETPVGSPDLGGLFPVKAQALQLVEAEDLQADAQTCWVPGPETPQGGGDRAAMQLGEEAEDGAPGLGERELPHEPVTDLHGAGVGQGEGAGAGVQLWEEAVTLGTLEDQSADANVQLLAEAEELQFTPGGSTEAALGPPREAGYLDTEQGGCVAPDVQPLDEADKPELVELVEAEDLQADAQLHGGASPETPQGGGDRAAVCLGEEAEDGAQGLGERELPHEPVTDLPGAGVGQGEGAGAEKQPGAEADEFSAGRGDPAALPVMTFGAQRPGAEVNGDVQHAEEEGELELVQGEGINEGGLFLVKSRALDMVEAEDSWADTQLRGGASPEPPQGGGDRAAVCLGEEAEDGAQGLGERELPHDPVLHPHGVIIRQGEGAPEGVQPREKAESLGTLEDQSTDASMQLLVETEKLKLTPGGSTEAAWQPPSEAGSPGTEQGGSMAPGVQALEEDDKPELGLGEETGAAAVHGEGTSPAETPVGSPDLGGLFPVKAQALQLVEAEDLQADAQTRWVPGPETPQGGGDRAAMQLGEEAEDGAPGLGERELPHEPVTDLHGAGVGQGEGAGAGVQLWEEAVTLGTLEDQSADANVQLLAEAEELQFTPGGSTEAALGPPREAGYLDTEQGGCVAPDVQPLDEADKPELVELVEAEDLQADTQLHGGASPETPQGGGDHAAVCLGEEAEDGGPTQEPAFHPQGVATRQGEGAGEGVQPWEEAVTLGTLEDQSADANVQLIAEAEKLKLTPGGSTEAARQLPSEAGSLDTEQGGNVAPDVQPLDEADKPELVELVEAEDLQADTQPCGVPGPEPPQGGGDRAAMQLGEEAEDGAQGLGERELPHEPVTDLPGAGVGQGEGAGAEKQPGAEADEFSAGRGDPAALPVMTFGAQRPGAEVNGDVQHAEEEGELELVQGEGINEGGLFLVKSRALDMVEAEDSWADTQLRGGASPEPPQGGGDRAAVCLGEEAEDGAQGLGERELPHDPVLHPHGVIIRQGEGAPEGVQPREKAESLGTLEDQSTDASMQLLVETEKLKLTPGGSTEAAWQPPSEAGSLGTEQGGSMAPGVQALEEDDKPELGLGEETGAAAVHGEGTSPAETPVGSPDLGGLFPVKAQALQLVEAEDLQADAQTRWVPGPETPQGGGDRAAMQLGEEAEDGAPGLGERELPHEPVTDLHGAGVGQGEGAGAGVQLWEEAVTLGTLEDQSADANVQLLAEAEELQFTPGGSTEADLAPLGAAGMQEGEQSQTPGLEAHTTDMWEGAAGAHVSPPAEAALYPQRAAEGPSLEAMLGAFTGPGGQILEDTQTLEILQGERADAEGGPLDGVQGLEWVQGERLEAGAKLLVDIRSLGIKQGHDDGVSVLAPLVSKVTLQINTLKLETMMQEDVLVPDVWRLGDSGQAAQSELQEQVSAQAVKVRLHTASQQPEEKPPHVMETERVAAGPAEPPKQEVPPASTLHTRVQQEEDAGNDQSGMVLRDSSLGDAAISSMQPQRRILGEQSKDLNVGQQEKKQEVGRKTSQEGKPSSGQPGAVTADGAGAAPRGSPEASLDPDHLYNVLFVGDSHVGKTSFLYRLHADTFNPHLNATVGLDYQVKNIVVDNKRFALRLWDSAGQERYHSITKQFFRKADGVVLMYDITSEYSFSDVRYWLSCIQEGAEDGVAILLLGNKTDCAAERRVPTEEGERLAKEHQLMFYECSAASGHNVSEAMVSLIRLLKVREDELKNKAAEVPKPLQKKKGCC